MTEPSQNLSQSSAPVRRFAVQPVETSSKSHRASRPKAGNTDSNGSAPQRRFVPQLEETSERSHRRGGKQAFSRKDGSEEEEKVAVTPGASGSGTRRFAPRLVETARRSRKTGDTEPTMKHTDKTDLSPGDKVHLPRHLRLTQSSIPEKLPEGGIIQRSLKSDLQPPESRFSYANLSKRTPRQASFRVPQLESITSPDDSDESNESNAPSLSTSPSLIADGTGAQKQARRLRESCDEKFSGYLLALAARAAEKQLQEQALAAFPNERRHEPVNHFAYRREGEDSDEDDYAMMTESFDVADAMQRRMSSTGWDLAEMQKHKEMLEEQRRKQRLADSVPPKKQGSIKNPWKSPFDLKAIQGQFQQEARGHIGGAVRDPGELSKMRSAASPPLLGKDIEFVMIQSPKQTMIDATQKPRSRNRKCEEAESRQHSGLWTLGGDNSPTLTARKNSALSPAGACLWGGFCNAPEKDFPCVPESRVQTGVMTPREETPGLYPSHALPSSLDLCRSETPPALTNIDSVLTLESTLEAEYPDTFITQLYNYLSLGYPALARKFDLELSKISRVSLEDIQRGDRNANTKGYVGVPEGEGWEEEAVKEKCGRWFALRLYVREWARQQPRMKDEGPRDWGGGARRGSWGI